MSINNRQAIQKSCIERRSNAWLTLGSESETDIFRSRRAREGFQITKCFLIPETMQHVT